MRLAGPAAVLISALFAGAGSAHAEPTPAPRLHLLKTRQSLFDLEVTGLLAGVPPGAHRFVRYDALLALPQVTDTVTEDESFEAMHIRSVQVSGVTLAELRQALQVQAGSNLISALCADGYEAHYSAGYIAAHGPLLVLKIEGLPLSAWARKRSTADPGPYMITNPHFVPSFYVHAHRDRPQAPDELVRLEFTTESRVYGPIAPRGTGADGEAARQGFVIARQNCLRCHGLKEPDGSWIGGRKAQRSWQLLSHFAQDDPQTFAAIIYDPRRVNPRSSMPANQEYDGPTLAALIAYFKSLSASKDQE